MSLFPKEHVIDGTYRVESVLSQNDRASVYVVTHVGFPEAPLVLKVAALSQSLDFERDTAALSTLTTPCVARVCDRGKLPDGRLYRVTQRLAGPTLREALETGSFSSERAMEILVALAAAVREAHESALGPCDLSVDNLMFIDGRGGRLCLMRALVPNAAAPSESSDQAALSALRGILLGQTTKPGAHEPVVAAWKPPSTVEDFRDAMARTGGPRTPASSAPGTHIARWEVLRRISETLQATVYEVKAPAGQAGVLKVAGSGCDHVAFTKHADLLARVQSRHVVRVFDFGKHEGTPYMVMEPLHLPQSVRLSRGDPLPIDAALQTVDELLWGAEAISKLNGAPSDFSLEHCYQGSSEPSPPCAVLTHAMLHVHSVLQGRAFGVYGRPTGGDHADAWSAAVALYELITGRLPFPTTKHSLAKAWMGMPIPIGSRRRDVPPDISELVHAILTGKRVSTAELRRELTRIRSTPATMRASAVPERMSSIPPRGSLPPDGRSSIVPARIGGAPDKGDRLVPSPDLRTMAQEAGPLLPLGGATSGPPALQIRSISPSGPPPVRRSIEPPPGIATTEWGFEPLPARCPLTTSSVAAMSLDGDEVLVVGRDAVARYQQGRWTVDPARETAGTVVSLVPMREGGFLAMTSTGPLLRLGASGGFTPWGASLERFSFHGAAFARDGLTLVGGTTDRKHGVVAKLVGESLTIVADELPVKPLRAAIHLPDGSLLAVCEGGSILRLLGAAIVDEIHPCDVDLHATESVNGELVVIGGGAWAFRVTTTPLAAQLEAVDTLSALTCLSVDGPTVWAGSGKGRILRRIDRHWRRMNRSFDGDPAVLAIHASEARVLAMLADGRLALGQPLT